MKLIGYKVVWDYNGEYHSLWAARYKVPYSPYRWTFPHPDGHPFLYIFNSLRNASRYFTDVYQSRVYGTMKIIEVEYENDVTDKYLDMISRESYDWGTRLVGQVKVIREME